MMEWGRVEITQAMMDGIHPDRLQGYVRSKLKTSGMPNKKEVAITRARNPENGSMIYRWVYWSKRERIRNKFVKWWNSGIDSIVERFESDLQD